MNQAQLFEVAIGLIPGVGNYLTRQLISYCGSAENVFRENRGKLRKIPGIGETLANAIINQDILNTAEEEILKAEKSGIKLLFYTNSDYPERLKQIPDAPTLLYCRGNANLSPQRIIGIVGTRKATEYGKETVDQLVEECKKYHVTVVSGLAYGIDIAAHKACLSKNVPTFGVMATGVDKIYPPVHKDTAQKMLENGGLLSEYKIGTKAEAAYFPARNRIIAGLSDAVIVVEAAERGGALITAEIANSYNREVFAVPGSIDQKFSIGCNQLIRDHKANILSCPSDLSGFMNWTTDAIKGTSVAAKKKTIDISGLSTDEVKVVQILEAEETVTVDDLSWKSQIPVNKLASILLKLEFEGFVKSLPGKKYKLN